MKTGYQAATAFLACLVVSLIVMDATAYPLVLFEKDVVEVFGARCLDGSPAGYYIEKATEPTNQDKWVIFLDSGGYCTNDCDRRLNSPRGSSLFWDPEKFVYETLESPNPRRNPYTTTWNKVFVPYCSGDYWSGQVTQPSAHTYGMYFAGHNILKALVHNLKAFNQFSTATQVVLTGYSAGGYGTFLNTDFIASTVPNARVVGIPQGGLFLRTMPFGQWFTICEQEQQKSEQQDVQFDFGLDCSVGNRSNLFGLYSAYVSPECASAVPPHDKHLCFEPSFAYRYTKSPMFIVQDLYDTDQIFNLGFAPVPPAPYQPPYTPHLSMYMSYFARCMKSEIDLSISKFPDNGMFVPACLGHFINNLYAPPYVNGASVMDAIGQWIQNDYKNATFVDQVPFESLGRSFNPTCLLPDDIQERAAPQPGPRAHKRSASPKRHKNNKTLLRGQA